MTKPKSVSSKDVAREAKVSQATVSYVLNNVPGVKIKPETKEAVLQAAKKLNYYPNLIARSMRLKKSMSIGVVSDKNVSNFVFMKVLEGIKDSLISRNYSMTLCLSKSQDLENADHLKFYSSNRIDGIIFVYATLTDEHIAFLVDNSIPFIVIHSHEKGEVLHLVKTDMSHAMLGAIRHLKDKEISQITYFGTGAGNLCDRRFLEYTNTMEKLALSIDQSILLKTPSNEEEIEACLEEYFSRTSSPPRAVICENSFLAFSLLKFTAKKRIRIPDEMAVISIGTSRFSTYTYPSLSSIEAPLYDMGYTGSELLFDIINGNTTSNVVVLEWTFIQRDSS